MALVGHGGKGRLVGDKRKNNLRFDFKRAAQKAYAEFPQLSRNTVFYHVDQSELHANNSFLGAFGHLFVSEESMNEDGSHASRGFFGVKAVVLKDKDDERHLYTRQFVFDHELAHTLTPMRELIFNSTLWSECLADAYAIIRDYSRHGIDSSLPPKMVVGRALGAILHGDHDHATFPVIAQIVKDRHSIDFSSLSPKSAFDLAVNYTKKFAPCSKDRLALSTELNFARAGSQGLLRFISSTCLSSHNPLVFLAGAVVTLGLSDAQSKEENREKYGISRAPDHAALLGNRRLVMNKAQKMNCADVLAGFLKNSKDVLSSPSAPSFVAVPAGDSLPSPRPKR